jgi:cold shock CspA family protein
MGTDLFFLKTDLEGAHFKTLQMYEHVTFVPGRNERGPCAYEVRTR